MRLFLLFLFREMTTNINYIFWLICIRDDSDIIGGWLQTHKMRSKSLSRRIIYRKNSLKIDERILGNKWISELIPQFSFFTSHTFNTIGVIFYTYCAYIRTLATRRFIAVFTSDSHKGLTFDSAYHFQYKTSVFGFLKGNRMRVWRD